MLIITKTTKFLTDITFKQRKNGNNFFMKKMIVFLFLFVVLLSGIPPEKEFSLGDFCEGEYIAYTTKKISNASIDLGFCFMNKHKVSDNVIGESVKVNNFEPATAIRNLNAKVIKVEQLNTGATIIYAYTNKINSSVKVDGEKVNLQIAHYNDYSIVGWPLILGSF